MCDGITIGGNVSIQISGPCAPADGSVTAAKINSEDASDGHVLTADGAGGAAWEAPTGPFIRVDGSQDGGLLYPQYFEKGVYIGEHFTGYKEVLAFGKLVTEPGNSFPLYGYVEYQYSVPQTSYSYTGFFNARANSANSGSIFHLSSLEVKTENQGTGSITSLYGQRIRVENEPSVAGSVVVNQYGLYISNGITGQGNATNRYGIYITQPSGTPTGLDYALYSTSGNVYFGSANVGIGLTPVASAALLLQAGTTAIAPLRITTGVAPIAPIDGDIWSADGKLYFYNGSTAKEIAFV